MRDSFLIKMCGKVSRFAKKQLVRCEPYEQFFIVHFRSTDLDMTAIICYVLLQTYPLKNIVT